MKDRTIGYDTCVEIELQGGKHDSLGRNRKYNDEILIQYHSNY